MAVPNVIYEGIPDIPKGMKASEYNHAGKQAHYKWMHPVRSKAKSVRRSTHKGIDNK